MKKQLLTVAALTLVGFGSTFAQRTMAGKAVTPSTSGVIIKERCSTPAPEAAWDNWFNQKVEEFKAQQDAQKLNNPNATNVVNYNIPVVVHIIHGGQAVGTYPNLNALQINSQITVLNQDYSGTGYKTSTYPATAFQTYVTNGSIPVASQDGSGRVAIANTGIQFCMAVKDKNGATMAEPGIDRVDWHTISGATDPALAATATALQTLIDTKIKPATIWDPTKYINMWVTDEKAGASPGLLGYATFPAGSTLTGISGTGTATTDGFWAFAHAFGSANIYPSGTYDPTYKYGRTCTHEIGHWLGLRHIWGDNGQCGATDYCIDTPPQKGQGGTSTPLGCYYGAPTYPQNANGCTRPDGVAGASITNVNGDMFMNFMDYTDDVAMYMFTPDQTLRIQTAMANGTYRKFLGTHGLCSSVAAAPVANFSFPSNICAGTAAQFTDQSSNTPTTWAWSVTPSTGVTITTASSQSPTINFTTVGSYTVSLTATNGTGNNTISQPVTVNNCTPPAATCPDTLSNFLNTDTLTIIGSSNGGYLGGNNGYADKEKGEFYSSSGIVGAKVTGGIVLFYRDATNNKGTKGTAAINFKLYNGNNTTGPAGAAINTFASTLTAVTATTPVTGVTYCGNPALGFTSSLIIPYSFNFATPVAITGDFIMSVTLPPNGTDTVAIWETSGTTAAAATAWEMQSGNTWFSFNDGTTNSWQNNGSLAILPKIGACPVGIADINALANNIVMFPNPSNGNINFVTTLAKAADLNFTVTNTLGQVVFQKSEKNVTNNVIGLDLTGKDKGIYLVTVISSNGEKTVKKIVIE